jgi:hypothetical protein
VFDIHLPDFAGNVRIVIEPTLNSTLVWFRLSKSCPVEYIANAAGPTPVIPSQHDSEFGFAVTQAKPQLQGEVRRHLVHVLFVTLGLSGRVVQTGELLVTC